MTKFCNAGDVSKQLGVSQDHVRHLIRRDRLSARKLGGDRGDYLIHPVDVNRLKILRELSSGKQDPLRPDVVWVVEACNFLIANVEKVGFQPELIIGVEFGGLFTASFISSTLRVPFLPLRVMHYDGTSKLPEVIVYHDYYKLSDVPILVMDDIADTGETLEAVYNHVVGCGVAEHNLRFATLHMKNHSTFTPSWYVDVVDGWVHYPWEKCCVSEA